MKSDFSTLKTYYILGYSTKASIQTIFYTDTLDIKLQHCGTREIWIYPTILALKRNTPCMLNIKQIYSV